MEHIARVCLVCPHCTVHCCSVGNHYNSTMIAMAWYIGMYVLSARYTIALSAVHIPIDQACPVVTDRWAGGE